MNRQQKCITLWVLLIIAMMLHSNYSVSGIIYGLDVRSPNATGEITLGTIIIRQLFYHLPFVWIFIIMYFETKLVRLGLFILSVVYGFAHAMHLVGEVVKGDDPSQVSLLSFTLVTAVILVLEHFKWYKQPENG